jgi:hypothetical protein
MPGTGYVVVRCSAEDENDSFALSLDAEENLTIDKNSVSVAAPTRPAPARHRTGADGVQWRVLTDERNGDAYLECRIPAVDTDVGATTIRSVAIQTDPGAALTAAQINDRNRTIVLPGRAAGGDSRFVIGEIIADSDDASQLVLRGAGEKDSCPDAATVVFWGDTIAEAVREEPRLGLWSVEGPTLAQEIMLNGPVEFIWPLSDRHLLVVYTTGFASVLKRRSNDEIHLWRISRLPPCQLIHGEVGAQLTEDEIRIAARLQEHLGQLIELLPNLPSNSAIRRLHEKATDVLVQGNKNR